MAANEQKESIETDDKQPNEEEGGSEQENDLENVDDVQLDNDESDHEMDAEPANDQVCFFHLLFFKRKLKYQ